MICLVTMIMMTTTTQQGWWHNMTWQHMTNSDMTRKTCNQKNLTKQLQVVNLLIWSKVYVFVDRPSLFYIQCSSSSNGTSLFLCKCLTTSLACLSVMCSFRIPQNSVIFLWQLTTRCVGTVGCSLVWQQLCQQFYWQRPAPTVDDEAATQESFFRVSNLFLCNTL